MGIFSAIYPIIYTLYYYQSAIAIERTPFFHVMHKIHSNCYYIFLFIQILTKKKKKKSILGQGARNNNNCTCADFLFAASPMQREKEQVCFMRKHRERSLLGSFDAEQMEYYNASVFFIMILDYKLCYSSGFWASGI